MSHVTRTFWLILAILLGTTLFYAVSAEQHRRSLQRATANLATGDVVTLVRALDGDTIVVVKEGTSDPITVRILGIKAFDTTREKDQVKATAIAAVAELERFFAGKSARVMLHTTPQDKHGRYLATLYIDEQDLAVHLLQQGMVLVYAVYPFSAIPIYQQAQLKARNERQGLWANPQVTSRADALLAEWRRQAP